MAIITLHGIRITDRVTVNQVATRGFQVFFDGEYINTAHSGAAAVGMAKAWLEQRQKDREAEDRRTEHEAREYQKRQDHIFLTRLTSQLGLEDDDLTDLIEVIKRRLKEDDD
jgi:hypothetical protein